MNRRSRYSSPDSNHAPALPRMSVVKSLYIGAVQITCFRRELPPFFILCESVRKLACSFILWHRGQKRADRGRRRFNVKLTIFFLQIMAPQHRWQPFHYRVIRANIRGAGRGSIFHSCLGFSSIHACASRSPRLFPFDPCVLSFLGRLHTFYRVSRKSSPSRGGGGATTLATSISTVSTDSVLLGGDHQCCFSCQTVTDGKQGFPGGSGRTFWTPRYFPSTFGPYRRRRKCT